MGVLAACMIVSFVVVSVGLLALWAMSTRRQDARLAALEAKQADDAYRFAEQARRHEEAIQKNVGATVRVERDIVWLATEFAKANEHQFVDPFDQTACAIRPPAP